MPYKLGLDLGANSIGWTCLELGDNAAPTGILATGVRVFPDGRNPKDNSSKAVARRLARGIRRNRDRYLLRRKDLLALLESFGLMPAVGVAREEIVALDPYTLRADALRRALTPSELGRALFHLHQRRGFKSNRKAERTEGEEAGMIGSGAQELKQLLEQGGHETLGAFLADRHTRREPVRIRRHGTGAKAMYAFYPLREMVESEFDIIRNHQEAHQALSPAQWSQIRDTMFRQRPLRPVERGRCGLENDAVRAYRALPTSQAFRIAQELANIRLSEPGETSRPFTAQEREVIWRELRRGGDRTFVQITRKLKLLPGTVFNLESARRDKLKGDETAKKIGASKALGERWHELPLDRQDEIVSVLLDAETNEEATALLEDLGVVPEDIDILLGMLLAEGTAALSTRAIQKLLPFLRDGLRYDEAVKAAGYGEEEVVAPTAAPKLAYYGEVLWQRIGTGTMKEGDSPETYWGKIPNPTVHVALNQLRLVVNAIIDQFGLPDEIAVETLRELGRSKIQRQEWERQQTANQKENDRRRKDLEGLGLPVNAGNLARLRLWEDQGKGDLERVCPYTGTRISQKDALSDKFEEDHILPFSRSLDDSFANRVLVTRQANREKADQTPFEAFGGKDEQWDNVLGWASCLPKNKQWRFAPDAMEQLSEEGDFLARHLTDSAYIARYARFYLESIMPGRVISVPGRLTAMLRRLLGLNSSSVLGRPGFGKDRTDHRHHAIDSLVVALTDRATLQRLSKSADKATATGRRVVTEITPPWENFVSDASLKIGAIVTSHKQDHGLQGSLHNDTAYGPAVAGESSDTVAVRKPLADALKKPANIRDPHLRARIQKLQDSGDDAALEGLLDDGGRPIRRIRLTEKLPSVQGIAQPNRPGSQSYKFLKRDGNHCIELWKLPDGKLKLQTVSRFEAAMAIRAARGEIPAHDRRPHPAARRLLRLHKNDCIAVGSGPEIKLFLVAQISGSTVVLAGPNETGDLRNRDRSGEDVFRYVRASAQWLRLNHARAAWVDPLGRVHDSGKPVDEQ